MFDLKPGDVSQVISDSGGHYIYKVNSKTEMPLDQAKNDIHDKLQNDRMREMMEKLNNSFKLRHERSVFWTGRSGSDAAARACRVHGRVCLRLRAQPRAPAQPPAPQKD